MIKVEKKEDRAAYEFLRRHRHDAQMIASMIYDLNGKTIAEAAKVLGMDITSFMVCIGHLYRTRIIKEVRVV